MADNKKRADKYEDKLKIKGSLDEVLKVSAPKEDKSKSGSGRKSESA